MGRCRQTAALLICAAVSLLMGRQTWAQSRPDAATTAIGKEVRVIYLSGVKRSGQLVSLTADEVRIRDHTGRVTNISLEVVRRVETEHHAKRFLALLGGVLGSAAAFTMDSCGEPSPVYGYVSNSPDKCPTPKPLLAIAGGALAGAFIGSGIDDAQRRVLFAAGARIRPALSAKVLNGGAALTFSLRW